MSVYIKEMKMPKQGTIIMILPDGTVQDMFFKTKLGEAVHVPPHGRLIDADAFERKVMFGDEEDLQDVIYSLRDYPAIIPGYKED